MARNSDDFVAFLVFVMLVSAAWDDIYFWHFIYSLNQHHITNYDQGNIFLRLCAITP